MIYITFVSHKKKQITKTGLIFWMTMWIGGMALVIFHPFFNRILDPLNIVRIFDLYVILSILIILFTLFFMFKAIQMNYKKLESLTRTLALQPVLQMHKDD
jgi:hypothetical protein